MVTTIKMKKLKTGKMWGLYHLLRTSREYKQQWIAFIMQAANDKVSKTANHPALYQSVTHHLMKSLIKIYHPTAAGSDACAHSSAVTPTPLSYEEKNALRFIAGYVSRKIYKNVLESSHPKREGMAACIKEMIGGCSECVSEDDTDAWLKTIDRGLWHVNQEVYVLFELMEEYIRYYFPTAVDHTEGSKNILIEELITDEDILSQWCFCFAAGNIDNEVDLMILRQMVNLYVTIRGFAFAETCLEMYKEAKGTTTSKKKALRKELSVE